MQELLSSFEQELISFNAPVLKYFKPPMANPEELTSFVRDIYGSSIIVPKDLLNVYEWHNGTGYENAENGIIKLGYLADELCLESLPNVKETIDADESVYEYKEALLFPFCTSFNGEALAFNLKEGSLIYCSTSDYEIPSKIKMYDNLSSFFETMIQFYKSNCFEIEEYGFINLNISKYNLYMEIGERMNPASDYWRVKREFQESE